MTHGDESWFESNRSCVWSGGGCCGCLVLLLLALLIVPIGGGVALFQGMKSSPVFKLAVETAQQDPRLIEQLGDPIETGLAFSGSINTSGSSGEADYSIPLKGPKGGAKLYVVATKRAGLWRFELLEAAVDVTGDRIDLLPGLPPEMLLPDDGEAQESASGSEFAAATPLLTDGITQPRRGGQTQADQDRTRLAG